LLSSSWASPYRVGELAHLSTASARRCRYCSRDHSPGSCPARSRSRSPAASAA